MKTGKNPQGRMSNIMSVSEEDFESSFIKQEAFTIMKAISESTNMMLKAVRILEKKLEKMEKERKSDKAVIFKLLRDIKDLKETRADKTIPKKSKKMEKKNIKSQKDKRKCCKIWK